MFLSIILLWINPFSFLFITLYILCGISDALDGYIARKLDKSSSFGAMLDSVADIIFIGVIFIVCIPMIHFPTYIYFWIFIIGFIKLTTVFVMWKKYRTIGFLHTDLNKLTGFLLALFPIFLYIEIDHIKTVGFICVMATIAALEEIVIVIKSNVLNRDEKSLFIRNLKK